MIFPSTLSYEVSLQGDLFWANFGDKGVGKNTGRLVLPEKRIQFSAHSAKIVVIP